MKNSIIIGLLFLHVNVSATIWQVGPSKTYTFCSQIASLVQHGDTIEIDQFVYVNDPQVIWNKNNLLIRGAGGRPILQAGSNIANDAVNGKGIFVISGQNVKVEHIEFRNASVMDHNGAGIRQEGRNLYVTHCKFDGNEMGILCGDITNCKTTVEYCEFVNGGSLSNPGYQHNIYINHIDTLIFRYNYSHNAIAEGHELKSRATNNIILYNRIANENSVDSRTIDLPNGGISVLLGNIIEQGINSANSNLLGYGLEGLTNPAPHGLYMVNNTFVNKKTTGSFINIQNGTDSLFLKNNILAGAKTGGLLIGTPLHIDSSGNKINDAISAFDFMNSTLYDYHLQASSLAKDAGVAVYKTILNTLLVPTNMYVDTCQFVARPLASGIDVGAFEIPFATITSDVRSGKKFTIYPDPCSGILHFKEPVDGRYIIYNYAGQKIQEGMIRDQSLDVTSLPTAVYSLQTGNQLLTFIKE